MKVVMVGSRNWSDASVIKDYILSLPKDTVVISGGAKGVDSYAEQYAKEAGLRCEIYPADWDTYGKSAGMLRNTEMIIKADKVVAFWDGESRGTKDSINKALIAPNVQEVLIIKQKKESAW